MAMSIIGYLHSILLYSSSCLRTERRLRAKWITGSILSSPVENTLADLTSLKHVSLPALFRAGKYVLGESYSRNGRGYGILDASNNIWLEWNPQSLMNVWTSCRR